MKAIETRYKGYRFRSRTEARWAVFLDTLGVPWEYEKQGYHLPSGPYLPDFWLPAQSCWLELKGEPPTEGESKFCEELAAGSGNNVFLFVGQPYMPADCYGWDESVEYDARGHLFMPDGGWDNGRAFCVCEDCGAVGIEYEARSDRLPCKECYRCSDARRGIDVSGYFVTCPRNGDCGGRCQRCAHGDRGHTGGHDRIKAAVVASRAARFEHGESPR